ncbi:MAG: hypothetical protein GY950_20020, partial [bacterium]|nr:hypothetical protein [bacterium]
MEKRRTVNYKGNVLNLAGSPRDKKPARKTIEHKGRTFNLPDSLRGDKDEDEAEEFYIWRTRRDSKVRSVHADREGKLFRWDDPQEGGHPGEDFGCRCRAEAVPLTADVTLVTDNEPKDRFAPNKTATEKLKAFIINLAKTAADSTTPIPFSLVDPDIFKGLDKVIKAQL